MRMQSSVAAFFTALLGVAVVPPSARADGDAGDASIPASVPDYSDGIGSSGTTVVTITPPYAPDSFTTALAAFPATETRIVDGYPLASRVLAATGHTLYLLQTFGESNWLPVAILDASDPAMDPCFVALTPDGEKIALGGGLDKPLYVFPTSLLSVASPVNLTTAATTTAAVKRYDLPYYSGTFDGERWLLLDVGGDVLGTSFVEAIDTDAPVMVNDAGAPATVSVIPLIPGASGGIAVDAAGDLVTGNGWDPSGADGDAGATRTGEIMIFSAAVVNAALSGGPAIDYETGGHLVAANLLSADSLGFDSAGNLDVGGGDVFGTTGHYGYADVVSAAVVQRALAGGAPADESNPGEVATVAPDPCKNDDWTGITYVPGVDMLLVGADLETTPPSCAQVDYSMGASPVTLYFPPGAPDSDGNGIPDGADPDFEEQEFYDRAQLSRLVNALDSKTADANFDATVDYDHDGTVGNSDFAFLRSHWGQAISN
jgi:hypothetical protein